MSIRLLILVLMTPILSQAQEMLVTTDGRQLNFDSYRLSDDGKMIEARTCVTCLSSIPIDSVAEMVSSVDEKIYHLKRLYTPSLKVALLELVTQGKVTIYKRISQLREKGSAGQIPKRSKGSADYTAVEQYFLEKDGVLRQILPGYGSQLQQGLQLKEFVNDDSESVRQIDNVKFELRSESLLQVVEDYNARAFELQQVNETNGRVSFVVVDDRKVKSPLIVMVNGRPSPLDKLVFTTQIPVSADSKVCIVSGASSRCQVIRGTRHFPVFFEVRINKAGQEIRFRRSHSKRFSNVAGRVSKD